MGYLSPELADLRTALQNIVYAITDLVPLCQAAHHDLAKGDEPRFNDWPGKVPVALSQSANPDMDYEGMYARREIGWPKRLDAMQAALTAYWEAWTDANTRLDAIGDESLAKGL